MKNSTVYSFLCIFIFLTIYFIKAMLAEYVILTI